MQVLLSRSNIDSMSRTNITFTLQTNHSLLNQTFLHADTSFSFSYRGMHYLVPVVWFPWSYLDARNDDDADYLCQSAKH